MPPMPPGIAGGAAGSGLSVISASVVRIMPAIEDALATAERVTFTGSVMPSSNISPYFSAMTS